MNAKEKQYVENIRLGYEEKKETKIDELRALDRQTKRPAQVFAYIFGTLGSLVLGSGMCLAMPEVIEGYMPLGIAVGIVGIVMVSVNYPIYLIHRQAKTGTHSGAHRFVAPGIGTAVHQTDTHQ